MAALSEHDRDIIAKHPLDTSLAHLQEPLRKIEQNYKLGSLSYDGAADDSNSGPQKAISRLLYTLQGHEVAFSLRSKTGSGDIASELSTLFNRVRKGTFSYEHYRALSRLVIQKASDSEIWSAVLDLITTLSRVTPPASVPATFDSTPITHSSASQQGPEQTRELLKGRLFEEIKHCTYRNVEGFTQKHFEGKDWTSRAMAIYQAVKSQHKDGRWTDFPDPPVQDDVVDWWFRFQDKFLSEERSRYYKTSSPKELVGAEARRQLDLFVKRNDGRTSENAHDLKDVKMIGELKESNSDKKGTLLQISRYVRDIFSCQPTRRYVPAFTLCGHEMETWIFDRSGPYGPGPFNIHDEPERFILVVTGYIMMNDEELGLDMFTGRDVDGRFVTLEQDGTENLTKLRLEPSPFTHQRAIVSRGTSCYLTKALESEDWSYVTKFSWTSDRRKPEADLLRLAHQRGVEGVAKLIGHHRITSINEMRSGLTFTKPYAFREPSSAASSFSQSFTKSQPPGLASRSFSEFHGLSIADRPSRKRKSVDVGQKPSKRSRSNSQWSSQEQNEVTYDVEEAKGTSLVAPNDGRYDNRVFQCLVISPAGRAIHKYEKKSQLLEALRDAIKAHRSLYVKGNILHRDISENNIIITDPKETGVTGMLIDLDLAKELGSGRSGARCRTGTMEFMAIEVLQGISHTYRHDIESFFYVLVWQCARRGWGEDWPNKSLLTKWYTDSYREIANAKRGSMDANGFEDILLEFPPGFDCVKPLCRELRGILFPYKDGLFVGTPKDPEILYEPIINAFGKAIDRIKATE